MVDKTFKKIQEKAEDFVEGVQEGQSEDAPVELPGTAKTRDTEGNETGPKRAPGRPPESDDERAGIKRTAL